MTDPGGSDAGGSGSVDASDPIERARAEGRGALTEAESKRLLADVGVSVPRFQVARSVEEAVSAAESIGYPVVAKVSSSAVQHKSEWGDGAGVAVGLSGDAEVREAAERILDTAEREEVEAAVLIEEAVDLEAGTELIVGGTRNDSFGPTVLVGLGGVFTEVLEDVSHRLAPVDAAEAAEMLDELAGKRLLTGYRNRPAADLEALSAVVVAVGDLLADREAIAEVDLNPVLATPETATALDALVVLEE